MSTAENTGHLIDLNNREDSAVDRLLGLISFVCPEWFQSIGVDPQFHWALIRPELQTPMLRSPKAEVDIVFGRMAPIANGPQQRWPPPIDYLVAVEAKCPPVKWEDAQEWAKGGDRKSNLRQQLERNLSLGFQRVSALHIVATPPSSDYWGALNTGMTLGRLHEPIATKHVFGMTEDLPVGHAILMVAGVNWKDETQSGGMAITKLIPAPLRSVVINDYIAAQLRSYLASCPAPQCPQAVFVRDGGTWRASN